MFLTTVLLCYVNVFSVCSGDHRFNTLLLQDDLKPKFDFNKTNVWKILENQEWRFSQLHSGRLPMFCLSFSTFPKKFFEAFLVPIWSILVRK